MQPADTCCWIQVWLSCYDITDESIEFLTTNENYFLRIFKYIRIKYARTRNKQVNYNVAECHEESLHGPNQVSLQPQQNIPQELKGEEEQLRKNITDLIMCKVLLDDMMRTMHINYRNEAETRGVIPETRPQCIVQPLKPSMEVKAGIERLFVIKVLLFYCQLPETRANMRQYISKLKDIPTMLLRPNPGTAKVFIRLVMNTKRKEMTEKEDCKFASLYTQCTQLHNGIQPPTRDPVIAHKYVETNRRWRDQGHPRNFEDQEQLGTEVSRWFAYREHGLDWQDLVAHPEEYNLIEGDWEQKFDESTESALKKVLPGAPPISAAHGYLETDKLKKGCMLDRQTAAPIVMSSPKKQELRNEIYGKFTATVFQGESSRQNMRAAEVPSSAEI